MSIQTFLQQKRNYGHEYPVDIQMIKDRVLLVLRLYDKINPDKVTLLLSLNFDFEKQTLIKLKDTSQVSRIWGPVFFLLSYCSCF